MTQMPGEMNDIDTGCTGAFLKHNRCLLNTSTATTIHSAKSFCNDTCVLSIRPFNSPISKKSIRDKSSDFDDHAICPPQPIKCQGKIAYRCALTCLLKCCFACVGNPSC